MKVSESPDSHLIDDLKKENENLRRQLEDLKARYDLRSQKNAATTDINPGKGRDEKILENEQRLQAIFDHAAIGIVEMDMEDRFIIVNNRVCEILEYSREELLTKKITDITAPDDVLKTIELNSRMHQGEFDIFAYEKRYLTRTGLPIWVYVTVSAIRDPHGKFLRSIGTIENISERKLAEIRIQELLRISDARATEIEAILSCIADGVVVYDSQGRIVRSNSAVEAILHIPESEKGLTLQERVFRGYGAWTEDGHQLSSEEMPAYRATMYGETVKNKVLLIRRPSENRWISISAAPLIVSGKHTGGVVSMSDITGRRKALDALKESEERFRLLFENVTEGVALHEMIYEENIPVNYKIVDCNPAFTEHTGIDMNKARGTLATELYGTKTAPYLQEYAQVAESRIPYRFETFFPNMKRFFVINVVSPKKGQFATVFEDITEQKRIEQEINQKNEELTRFIYSVSHDLKSPLVTIQAFTSYLKEDIGSGDKDAQNKDINYIQNAADKMGKLLDELLELSRIGRKEKAKTEVPLKTVAESAVDLVAGRIGKNRIRIIFTGPPVMLYGHMQRFVQLYQNLIDNSAKFMGNQPEPFIEIGSYLDKKRNNAIILYVKDNGTGIDPRYTHRIFGLFEKLDNNTEGTGIGLALVRRIVEVHGGSVWFVSEGIDKGTTFYFTLEGTRIIK
jgi:PAS domain S-box-containing protein